MKDFDLAFLPLDLPRRSQIRRWMFRCVIVLGLATIVVTAFTDSNLSAPGSAHAGQTNGPSATPGPQS